MCQTVSLIRFVLEVHTGVATRDFLPEFVRCDCVLEVDKGGAIVVDFLPEFERDLELEMVFNGCAFILELEL